METIQLLFKVNVLSCLAIGMIELTSSGAYATHLSYQSNSQLLNQVETIATGFNVPYEVAASGNSLVVTTYGSLAKIDEFGGVSTIAPLAAGSPAGVLVFGQDYIVVEYATGSLLRILPDGQKSTIATGLGLPVGVAQQGDDFIVVDIGTPDDNVIGDARLLRVSLSGDISVISSNDTENLGAPAAVFVDGENFWLTDFNLGRLLLVSSTGQATEIATGLGQPLDIDFNGENFIITDFAHGFDSPGNGRLLEVSKSGEIKSTITGIGNPSGLTFQGSNLIFTDVLGGGVSRIRNFSSVPESSSVFGLISLGIFGAYLQLKRTLK